jgi:signal transduction histidine kinase
VTSLRAFAQLLLRQAEKNGIVDQVRVKRGLQVIDQQSEKLSHLVSQLLDIARIQSGRLSIEKQEVCVSNIVRELVDAARVHTTQHSFNVKVEETMADVDPLRIEQVIANLLDNAVKYSPDGGQIDVEVSQPDRRTIEVSVRDHGIGIPVDSRERIFDRFNQAHLRSHVSGMGLGLYISRQIVELHGGQIEVESPGDGGTRVVVKLPVRSHE